MADDAASEVFSTVSVEVESPGEKRGRAPASFKGNFGARSDANDKPKFKAGGGRLFIGNLESEKVTREEFKEIFEQYGEVVEVSLHRSYGFVQFSNEEDMLKALDGEQGRQIGSRNIDIQRAKVDGRDKNQGRNARSNGNYNSSERDRDHSGNKRRRNNDDVRERSPQRQRRDYTRNSRSVTSPRDGFVAKIILLGESQRNFAQSVGDAIGDANIPWELEMLDGRTLSQALRDSEANLSRYALIIGRENVQKGTTTIKLLHLKEERGRCPTFDLPTDELVDLMVKEERKLGFTDAGRPSQNNSYNQPKTNDMTALQQQLAALQQQLSQMQQPQMMMAPQLTQMPMNMMPQVQQHQNQMAFSNMNTMPPAQNDLQEKILEQQKMIQQQIQQFTQLQQQQAQMNSFTAVHDPPPQNQLYMQQYPREPVQNQNGSRTMATKGKPASMAQLADLSKLLGSMQRKREFGSGN